MTAPSPALLSLSCPQDGASSLRPRIASRPSPGERALRRIRFFPRGGVPPLTTAQSVCVHPLASLVQRDPITSPRGDSGGSSTSVSLLPMTPIRRVKPRVYGQAFTLHGASASTTRTPIVLALAICHLRWVACLGNGQETTPTPRAPTRVRAQPRTYTLRAHALSQRHPLLGLTPA